MAVLDVETNYSVYKGCILQVGKYLADESIAVGIFSLYDGPVARITVCLDDPTLAADEAYIDTNNCPWAPDFLESNGFAKRTGRTGRSGYCEYPVMKFDRTRMMEFGGEV